ncbi:4Fe-4S binding protein [Singulisphaera sp. PoT]|uniref:4Fe-4S binding protein n=1 Tax=Singulisphaera sp. PoT TaxID=3411797 RepID=UPI003BF5D226
MSKLDDHPTVQRFREAANAGVAVAGPEPLDAGWLRQVCLEAGADDVGIVAIDRPELDDQRAEILAAFPRTKTLIAFVCRINRDPIRSPARSVANLEFHGTLDHTTEVARRLVTTLERRGIRAMNPASGFPMELQRPSGRPWVVAHKPVAVAAGLGRMGIHRNIIHPRFGNFILLGTILVDAEVSAQDRPIDYNPCLECKLCVAACPVGAIAPDGNFNFSACYTHNYREFMGGFSDWVETIVESRDAADYRSKVSPPETSSMWQSLSFGPNYKAAYCMAVCPAGEDVIGPFLQDRKGFLDEVVRPLQDKEETLYVIPKSDAEEYATRRFPRKTLKRVRSGLRSANIRGFLQGLPLLFQREQVKDLDATYHFTFTGRDPGLATIRIRDKTLQISHEHVGEPDLRVIADSDAWLGFIGRERSLVWSLIRRKIRLKGSPRLLAAFGRCFPS